MKFVVNPTHVEELAFCTKNATVVHCQKCNCTPCKCGTSKTVVVKKTKYIAHCPKSKR